MRTVHPFPGPHPPSFNGHPVIDPLLDSSTPMATSPPVPYESRPVSPAQAQVLDSLVSQLAQAAAQSAAPGPSAAARGEGDAAIHNILSSVSRQPSAADAEQPPWSANPGPENGRPPPPHAHTSTLGKRKLTGDGDDTEDQHAKIRRVVRDHVTQNIHRMIPMTTVVCLHAAVAQKSYGTEKRFLCPPPVVHIEGPVWHMRSQLLGMSVIAETGERSFDQKTPLDGNMAASFKFLHVTGTAKAKSFQLSLDIYEPEPEGGQSPGNGRVWASFDSAPVTIISKPSKKTAKTRNISSCILAGGPVSLFNRINSQTVRTKYMTIDQAQLCASNVTWSAFNVNVVRRSTDSTPMGGPTPVTYGSEIVLSDTHSGISTAPLVVRKVDKGRIIMDDGSPVSQMQKIALQRVNPDGSRHYLSAAGPIPGTPGVVPPPAPGTSQQAGTHPLLFQSPRVHEEEKDGVRVVVDEVDDYLCWTIVGISKFQYTFFDALGENGRVPELPITPFPTLFTSPVYRPPNNSLELTVSNFFYDNPDTRTQVPLDVYLGSIGPLRSRVYQGGGPAGDVVPHRYATMGHLHSIVVIDMPSIKEIMDALAEDAAYAVRGAASPDDNEPNREDAGRRKPREKPAPPPLPPQALIGRTLPLLFVRARDGVGYHSGRTIALDNVFAQMEMNPHGPAPGADSGWVAAAQAAQTAAGGSGGPEVSGWTLRVL